MFMAADEFPLPHEYRFFRFDGLQSHPPEDLDERTIVFLDCGNIDRNPIEAFKGDDAHILNIDHHHDNTRFGTVNHVVRGRVVHGRDRVGPHGRRSASSPTIEIAEALYVGARHRHRQVHVREHRPARARDGGGADRGRDRRARDLPPALRGHAVREARAARPARWRASRSSTTARSRSPTSTATTSGRPGPRRATPRASSTTCARSRARRSPRSRASCSTATARARRCRCARRTARSTSRRSPAPGAAAATAAPPGSRPSCPTTSSSRSCASRSPPSCSVPRLPVDGLVLVDKPAGKTSHDLTLATRRGLGVRKAGHAGTLDPFATGLLLVLVGRAPARAALPHGAAEDLRDGRAARRGLDDGRSRGRDHRDRRAAARPARAADRRGPPAPADLQRRARPGPARLRAAPGAARRSRSRSARSRSTASSSAGARATARRSSIDCSSGTYVRSLIADLGDAYCEELRRTRVGPFDVADADPTRVLPLEQALGVPAARRRSTPTRRGARPTAQTVAGRAAGRRRGRGPARRRRRPGRDRRAARRRGAEAHRRLPRVKVTRLPDAEPRPRRVAVGTFDGVHRGHREVIARRRHRR